MCLICWGRWLSLRIRSSSKGARRSKWVFVFVNCKEPMRKSMFGKEINHIKRTLSFLKNSFLNCKRRKVNVSNTWKKTKFYFWICERSKLNSKWSKIVAILWGITIPVVPYLAYCKILMTNTKEMLELKSPILDIIKTSKWNTPNVLSLTSW